MDLELSFLEMKGKVALPHLRSPNHHHEFLLFSNWRVPFGSAEKALWRAGGSPATPSLHQVT